MLLAINGRSQQVVPDSVQATPGVQAAIHLYHTALSPENGLYNGSEYPYNQYYPFRIAEGHPFLVSQIFAGGVVKYDGMVYQVPLLLDIAKGALVVRAPSNLYCMLDAKRVEWFQLHQYNFQHLRPDSSSWVHDGYYAVLDQGPATLYKAFLKTFTDNTNSSNTTYYRNVVEKDYFFIRKGGIYFRVRRKKGLLSVLADRRKEVQQFMRTHKIRIRKDPENAFKNIVHFYNSTRASD